MKIEKCHYCLTGLFLSSAVKNKVSSPGWLIRQKGEDKKRMTAISFQAEDGREWVDLEEKREQSMDKQLKKLNTFGHDDEKEAIPENTSVLPAEKKEWRLSTAASSQGKKDPEGETEEMVMEKADSQLTELTDGIIMSNQTRPEGYEMVKDREEVSSTKSGSVSGSFSDNSSNSIASVDGSVTTTIMMINSSFDIDYDNTSDHGSAENISTAVIPITKICSNSNEISCSATNSTIKRGSGSNSAGHGTMYTAISAENPHNVRATSDTSRFGSFRDSSVHESPFGSRLDILAGTHSATSNYETGSSGFLDVRNPAKSRLGSDKLDTLLWSEQVKSANKSVDTKSEKIPRRAGESVNSKGPDGSGEMLHGLKIRGLESDQSAHPPGFRDPVCIDGLFESDCDSGSEDGEVLHQSQFTEAAKTKKEVQGFSGTRPDSISSGSASSVQMHQDSPSHSAVVTLQGSESNHMTDREWAEVVQGWGSLGFVVEQPTEVEEKMGDFFVDKMNRVAL